MVRGGGKHGGSSPSPWWGVGGNMGEVRCPHGEGWGETWGKFAVPMVGGGGEHGGISSEKCPTRGAKYTQIWSNPHQCPTPPQVGGGGVSLIGALASRSCIHIFHKPSTPCDCKEREANLHQPAHRLIHGIMKSTHNMQYQGLIYSFGEEGMQLVQPSKFFSVTIFKTRSIGSIGMLLF